MNKMLGCSEFRDVYVSGEENKHFCYRTGMTVYEEVFANGRYMAAGWNTSGYTLNVLEDFPTRMDNSMFREPQAFDLEADGVSLGWDWDLVDFSQSEEIVETTLACVTHCKVVLRSTIKPVEVCVHTILDGTPMFTRWLTVKNLSQQPMNINAVAPICGGIEALPDWKDYMKGAPDSSKIYSLGYMDSAIWCHEGYFKWHDLSNISYGITGNYQTDRFRHPMFVLRNNLLGNMMFAQLGWSGGYRFDFLLDTDSKSAKLSYKIALDMQKPFLVLAPFEAFELPKVHIGMLHGDLDDAVNGMHSHIRRSVFTQPVARGVKGWIEGGMGPERTMDISAFKHFADTLAMVGAETMIIDAGWYCPAGMEAKHWRPLAGDWYHDPQKYPNGMKELREYAHSKGLLFGMWMEPERIGKDSNIYEKHPDWLAKRYDGGENDLLDMTKPEVVSWVEAEITRVIRDYELDLFRLDFNVGLSDHLFRRDDGSLEQGMLRYYKNVNDMFYRLKRKFPEVVFENCASGGGRTDLEFASNFTHTWVSDWNRAPRSFAVTNGMTMVLPPEYVDRLGSGMFCHTMGSLDFQLRNAIFGRPTSNDYNAMGSKMNSDQIAFVKHTLDIYKEQIRPYVDESKIYHHTPELISGHRGANGVVDQPQGTGILERTSGDGRHGVIGIFKLADAVDEDVIVVYPKGINMSLRYRVSFDNCGTTVVMEGHQIASDGLRVRLSGSMVSELIVYEAVG